MVYSRAASDCSVSVSALAGEGTALSDFNYNCVAVVYGKAAAPIGKSAGSRTVEGQVFVDIIVSVAEAVALPVGVAAAQHFFVIKALKRNSIILGGKGGQNSHIGNFRKKADRRTAHHYDKHG